MLCHTDSRPSPGADTTADAIGDYEPVETVGETRAWAHARTGLRVELYRYARYRTRHDNLPDFYEYQLVIRPAGGEGTRVDSTTTNYGEGGTDGDPVGMAREWMRAHADGEWGGARRMVKLRNAGITTDDVGPDVTVTIKTEGEPEKHAEYVHMHAHDAAVRAMQALRNGEHPDDCEGLGITIDWDGVLSGEYADVRGEAED